METNEHNCPLADKCKVAGTLPACTTSCTPFIAIQARYKAANIPLDYKGIYLHNSPPRDAQADIYTPLEAYVKSFAEEDVRIKSLYLYSTATGTGKTTTACALLNEYIKRRFAYYVRRGERVPSNLGLFADINDIQRRYNLATMTDDKDGLRAIKEELDRIGSVEFAVLDDVGVRTDATQSFRSLVHAVINQRLTNQRPTVYTSNLKIHELESVFDRRLADRVRDMTAEFTFKGDSKRGRR
ncbi:MAG: DNA replication protein [Actinobacteria bacterium]|nr:DNA replication protein [Actinomycetota bacterium]